VEAAEAEGVSLNQYINTVLAQAAGRAAQPRPRPGAALPEGLDPLLRKLEDLSQRLEHALARQAALPETRHASGIEVRPQQPAQLALREGEAAYGVDTAQPGAATEEPAQPDS
jgi:hypothetical protein